MPLSGHGMERVAEQLQLESSCLFLLPHPSVLRGKKLQFLKLFSWLATKIQFEEANNSQ